MPADCLTYDELSKIATLDAADPTAKCKSLDKPVAKDAEPAPLPEGMWVSDDGTARRIVRPWFQPAFPFMLFFCVFWDSFLVMWYWEAGKMLARGEPPSGLWLGLLFPIFHVLIGVGLTYITLGGLLNRTVVEVAGGRLRVWNGPLPFGGNRDLAAAEVGDLYCEEYRPASTDSDGKPRTPSYRLMALLADGRVVPLLQTDGKTAVRFYEQQLESWLGLAPQPISGKSI